MARRCLLEMTKLKPFLQNPIALKSKLLLSTSATVHMKTAVRLSKHTVTINIIDRKRNKITMEANLGDTVLDTIIDNDLDIESFGVCEGTLACSTCHVILEKKIYDLLEKQCTSTYEEMDMLDLACGLTETSRLGCQIEISKEMENCTMEVPEEATDAREL